MAAREKLYVVYGAGSDAVGLVQQITRPIADARANIVDMRQDVLHGLFTLFMLVDLAESTLAPEQFKALIAAIGDDLPDLGMLRRAGVGACPADAISIVRDAAALRLTKPGGAGAVREMCDLILEVRKGSRADRPAAVAPEPSATPPADGDVIPFPGSRG